MSERPQPKPAKRFAGKMQVLTIKLFIPGFLGHNNKEKYLRIPVPAFTDKDPKKRQIFIESWGLSEPVETPKGMKLKTAIVVNDEEGAQA